MISIKTTEASASAETIANNVDLLNQILLRLPPKSLLKFKCVSKQWQSLISRPTFSRCHKSHVNSPCALMVESLPSKTKTNSFEYEFVSLHSSHSEAPFKSLTFVNSPGKPSILQSCNGLLLCSCFDKSRKEAIYYVCNPTTRQCIQLPPLESHRSVVVGVNLAFDPSKSPYYKVVCVRCNYSSEEDDEVVCGIDVYSSKETCWMSSTSGLFTISGYIEFRDGVFWNGAIYWLSRWGESLYFGVDEDQVHEMPALSITRQMVVYFGESRGHFHLVEIVELPSIKLDVYEMSQDYSGWNFKHQVDLGAVVTAFPEMAETKSYVESCMLQGYFSK